MQQCINRRPIVIVFFVAVQYTYSIESSPHIVTTCLGLFRKSEGFFNTYKLNWSSLPKTLTELRAVFVCGPGDSCIYPLGRRCKFENILNNLSFFATMWLWQAVAGGGRRRQAAAGGGRRQRHGAGRRRGVLMHMFSHNLFLETVELIVCSLEKFPFRTF